jgi:hypothetical protein
MTIHPDYFGNDPRGISDETQMTIDQANDDLDSILEIIGDARGMIDRLERLRAAGTLKVPALQCFMLLLDDQLTDLLAGDWQRLIAIAGWGKHGKMPSVVEKPTAPITPRAYSEVKE